MSTPTEQHLREALEDLVSNQPFRPDTSSILQRGASLRRRTIAARATAGAAVAAAAALVGVTASSAATHHATDGNVATVTVPANNQSLTELASYITASTAPQAGDATLVQRTQSYPDRSPMQGFDLYTDSGEYFYAQSESGLPAAIASNANQGDGMSAREIAAAEYAVSGNPAVADRRMAYAPFADGKPPTLSATQQAQNLAAAGKAAPESRAVLTVSMPTTTSGRTQKTPSRPEPVSLRSAPGSCGSCPPCQASPSPTPRSPGSQPSPSPPAATPIYPPTTTRPSPSTPPPASPSAS